MTPLYYRMALKVGSLGRLRFSASELTGQHSSRQSGCLLTWHLGGRCAARLRQLVGRNQLLALLGLRSLFSPPGLLPVSRGCSQVHAR